MNKGYFIAVEGLDFSGKSTALTYIANWMRSRGVNFTMTREPGGTMLGDGIRELLLGELCRDASPTTLALLFNASRSHHVEKVIKPSIESGRHVICDRYTLTTLGYQRDCEWVKFLNEVATGGCEPDLFIILDITLDTYLERISKAKGVRLNHLDSTKEEELLARKAVFLDYAANSPHNCLVVDANQSLEETRDSLDKILEGIFGIK